MIIAEFIVLPVFFILNNLSFDQRFLGIVGISIWERWELRPSEQFFRRFQRTRG